LLKVFEQVNDVRVNDVRVNDVRVNDVQANDVRVNDAQVDLLEKNHAVVISKSDLARDRDRRIQALLDDKILA
jgi:hypothetical protein